MCGYLCGIIWRDPFCQRFYPTGSLKNTNHLKALLSQKGKPVKANSGKIVSDKFKQI